MALPTLQNLKDYLRIETAGYDTPLTAILAQAQAAVETWLQRPITAEEQVWVDEGGGCPGHGVPSLLFPIIPIEADSETITDADAVELDADTYRVDVRTGVIRAAPGITFANPPYTITATAGLSASAAYATVIEPAISRAIILQAADWYHNTNPSAQAEGAGGGVYTQLTAGLLSPAVKALLQPFRLERVA